LESTDDPNPVAHLSEDISYIVKVTTDEGCFAYDTVNVRVFKTAPDIFVPTAFTPNGDGTNDVFKAIPVGITSLDYFRVFNRWGQLVYNSPQIGSGWDGKVNGKLQATDSYVWMVQGTDFTGKVISKKGTVTLIR
jgi:gliding motility-associated-like protein